MNTWEICVKTKNAKTHDGCLRSIIRKTKDNQGQVQKQQPKTRTKDNQGTSRISNKGKTEESSSTIASSFSEGFLDNAKVSGHTGVGKISYPLVEVLFFP